jgi:3-oxoacyl-ACP reductase-like protein
MSIFGMIKDAIFGAARQPQPAPSQNAPAFAIGDAAASAASAAAAQAAAAPAQPVDVEAVLTGIERSKGGPALNWRSSIVDLMKLLDLDSSLGNREALATELGYTGARDGSAEMNIWLHRRVMEELEKNGGRVPATMTS